MTRKGKRGETHPFVMQRGKETKKVAQSDRLTPELFTTCVYVPTVEQIKAKPPVFGFTYATDKGMRTLLSSRYLNVEMLNYLLNGRQKKGGKTK
jgi:hypothetical protein